MGELNNSITHGEGNAYGFLGEKMAASYFGAAINHSYDWDLTFQNLTIDVKTKHCTSEPQPDYFCSVAAFNTRQKCDYYVFVRVLKDFSAGWILGGISKKDFFEQATFFKSGDLDPSSNLGWKFKADCYNLRINQLVPCEALKKALGGSI